MDDSQNDLLALDKELDELLGEPDNGEDGEPEEKVFDPEKVKQLDSQRRHWRKKAQEAEAALAEAKKAAPPPPKAEVSEEKFATKEELAEIQLRSKGLDDFTIDFIKTYAKGKGKSVLDVVDDEAVKTVIAAKKQEGRLGNAIPEPSAGAIKFGSKSYSEMTPEEKKANYAEMMRKTIAKNAR